MSDKPADPKPIDPMKAWRDWFANSEREWSEAMTRMMKEDGTARAVGQEITASLYARQMFKQNMSGTLASMNLATQDQLAALGERIGSLEDAVARVEAGMVQLRHALNGAALEKPKRTRRLASAPQAGAEQPSGQKDAAPAQGRGR